MPSTDPARLGVGRATFDGYSQGAGGSSLQTKGVSIVKLCLERRKKDKRPRTCEQNTVDLSGFFFYPCKINTDGWTLQGGSGCGGSEPTPGPILAHPSADSLPSVFPCNVCAFPCRLLYKPDFLLLCFVVFNNQLSNPWMKIPTANIL